MTDDQKQIVLNALNALGSDKTTILASLRAEQVTGKPGLPSACIFQRFITKKTELRDIHVSIMSSKNRLRVRQGNENLDYYRHDYIEPENEAFYEIARDFDNGNYPDLEDVALPLC